MQENKFDYTNTVVSDLDRTPIGFHYFVQSMHYAFKKGIVILNPLTLQLFCAWFVEIKSLILQKRTFKRNHALYFHFISSIIYYNCAENEFYSVMKTILKTVVIKQFKMKGLYHLCYLITWVWTEDIVRRLTLNTPLWSTHFMFGRLVCRNHKQYYRGVQSYISP